MARGGWTGFLRIRDDNAATTLGTLSNGFDKVGTAFKKGFIQNFNSFTLMKKGIDAVVDSAKALIKESRELVTTSVKFSIPIEQLGQLRNVAVESGLGVNGLTGAIGSLHTVLLNGVVRPGGEAAYTLAKLGIEQEKLVSISRRTGDAFWQIVKVLRAITDETEREMRTRAIFGAGYQDVIVIVSKTSEEIEAMKQRAHKYDTQQTKSNELTAKSYDKTIESLKDIGQLLAPILGMVADAAYFMAATVATIFGMIVAVITHASSAIKSFWRDFVNESDYYGKIIGNSMKKLNPFNNYSKEDEERDNSYAKKDWQTQNAKNKKEDEIANKKVAIAEKGVLASVGKIQDSLRSFGRHGNQFLTNFGVKDDAVTVANRDIIDAHADKKEAVENYHKNYLEIQEAKKQHELILKAKGAYQAASYKRRRLDPLIEKGNELQKEITDADAKIRDIHLDLKEVRPDATYDRETGQFVVKEKGGPTGKPEDMSIVDERLAQLQRERTMNIEKEKAGLDTWLKWNTEIYFAEKELANIQETNRQWLAEHKEEDIAKRNELANKELAGEIKVIEAKKKYKNLFDIAANQASLATTLRMNSAIEQQQGRDLFGMKMRGVSAIDQQNITFRNSVDKLKREEEKLEVLKGDKKREAEYLEGTGPAALALKASIQELTFESAKQMDTLMAMQYNYVSSDAAKKGMGGGITMVNNPIKIAEQSRDYLKKIYDAMMSGYGINGQFDVVRRVNLTKTGEPIQLSGKDIR